MDALLEYTGILLHGAQARTKVLDHDHQAVPVLCLDIELDSPMRNTMHVEQPFPADHFAQCTAAAHRLKKGMHITVQAPLVGLKLIASNATHIHIINTPAP